MRNKSKSLTQFIKENRTQLDKAINDHLTRYDKKPFVRDIVYLNDEERRKWILNDEGLYNWARSEGVKI